MAGSEGLGALAGCGVRNNAGMRPASGQRGRNAAWPDAGEARAGLGKVAEGGKRAACRPIAAQKRRSRATIASFCFRCDGAWRGWSCC